MLLDDSAVLQARVALRLPWWSLSTGFEAVRQMAGLQGDAALQTCQYCMVFYVIRGVTIRSRHKPPGSK